MSETPPSASPRDTLLDKDPETTVKNIAAIENAQKQQSNAPSLDVKALTDRTLHFLATASNETLGACLVGLGAGTYLILGRVGLVLIGVVGGVVLHATWEGHAHNSDSVEQSGKAGQDARKRELGVDVAHRLLELRGSKAQGKDGTDDYTSDLNLQLYLGKPLDFSDFKPETAEALTELVDAIIRDYVKYVLRTISIAVSNTSADGGMRPYCRSKSPFQPHAVRHSLPSSLLCLIILPASGPPITLSIL